MSKKVLIDYRCPHCNVPVVGKLEVDHVPLAKLKKQVECKGCKSKVILGEPYDEGLGTQVCYEAKNENK